MRGKQAAVARVATFVCADDQTPGGIISVDPDGRVVAVYRTRSETMTGLTVAMESCCTATSLGYVVQPKEVRQG